MSNQFIVIGGSSELGTELANVLRKENNLVFGISRNDTKLKIYNETLIVDDYIDDFERIKNFINEKDNPVLIFMNGYLKENRPDLKPDSFEIEKTIDANYLVPFILTDEILKNNLQISKFIFLSSISAIKPRYKNFIYGLSKQSLEKSIKSLLNQNFILFRFGMIETKMSKNHAKAPMTITKYEAANLIFKNINKSGIVYPLFGLRLIGIVIKLMPLKILNFLERNIL
tara:strand:+ start:13793 stop:14476 length:684 start_codon:yes stop_codon:yes gene_type:complete